MTRGGVIVSSRLDRADVLGVVDGNEGHRAVPKKVRIYGYPEGTLGRRGDGQMNGMSSHRLTVPVIHKRSLSLPSSKTGLIASM